MCLYENAYTRGDTSRKTACRVEMKHDSDPLMVFPGQMIRARHHYRSATSLTATNTMASVLACQYSTAEQIHHLSLFLPTNPSGPYSHINSEAGLSTQIKPGCHYGSRGEDL